MSGFWESIKQPENTNLIMAVATVVIAIFTALTFYLVLDSTGDTQKLITAAQTQANAASDQADAAQQFSDTSEDINGRLSDAVDQLQAAADNARKSLDASSRQSRASLDATVKQFQDEQRAWVGLGQYTIGTFNDHDPFTLSLPWVNSGKTPAVMAETAISYEMSQTLLDGPPIGHKYIFVKASAIAPQGVYVTSVTNTDVPAAYAAINEGATWLYFFGEFRYHDVHGKVVHTTKFCLYYSRLVKQMSFCQNGNDMD